MYDVNGLVTLTAYLSVKSEYIIEVDRALAKVSTNYITVTKTNSTATITVSLPQYVQ